MPEVRELRSGLGFKLGGLAPVVRLLTTGVQSV